MKKHERISRLIELTNDHIPILDKDDYARRKERISSDPEYALALGTFAHNKEKERLEIWELQHYE